MGKLALVALVGEEDNGINLNSDAYIHRANLPFFKYNSVQDVSVHEFMKALKQRRLEPTELAMDLLVIACTMYAADTRINRKKFAEDSWTRIIDLFIPVSVPDFWNSQKELLERIFKFLTGDIWSITFRSRVNANLLLSPRGNRRAYQMPYETDTVCLFSGGMDSLIGATDLLERGVRPLLLGHAKSSDVTPYQANCYRKLADYYAATIPSRVYAFIRVPKNNLFDAKDDSERGRSFLFLTLGAICGSTLQEQSTLIVPENGMISLNIPLTPLRTGSHSTRTTHPHYLYLMQTLFNNMQMGVTIHNPYQFKTKGEMLRDCLNQSLVAGIESMSCSHPSGRWQGYGNGHCGYCVPCIIRRAAFKAAGVNDQFAYRKDILAGQAMRIKRMEGADIIAFKYMIEKVRVKPVYLIAAIRSTGPLGPDITPYVDTYQRALNEVADLLNSVIIT